MPDRYGTPDDELVDSMPDDVWSAAQRRALAIVDCGLCDDDGYRNHRVCDHRDYTAAARRGMAKVRAALRKGRS